MKSKANAIEADANTMREVDKCIKLVQERIRGQLGTNTHRDEVVRLIDAGVRQESLADDMTKLLRNRQVCLQAQKDKQATAPIETPKRAEESYSVLYQVSGVNASASFLNSSIERFLSFSFFYFFPFCFFFPCRTRRRCRRPARRGRTLACTTTG